MLGNPNVNPQNGVAYKKNVYPKNTNKFNGLLKEFKLKTRKVDDNNTDSTNSYVENIKTDCLFVMDDDSALAEKSNDFAIFLNVAEKFKFILFIRKRYA